MRPSADRDEPLIRRARAGDAEAFGALARGHQDALYSLCHRLCAGDGPAAEDLAQETFLRLHRHLDRLEPDRPLWPWLRRVALNLFLNQQRGREPERLPLEAFTPAASTGDPLAPNAQALDRRIDIDHALGLLPAKDRSVLVLRYLESLGQAEIARALDLPESTVESRLFRARKRLAEMLRRLDAGGSHRPATGVSHATPLD